MSPAALVAAAAASAAASTAALSPAAKFNAEQHKVKALQDQVQNSAALAAASSKMAQAAQDRVQMDGAQRVVDALLDDIKEAQEELRGLRANDPGRPALEQELAALRTKRDNAKRRRIELIESHALPAPIGAAAAAPAPTAVTAAAAAPTEAKI